MTKTTHKTLHIALAQINPIVGDVTYNLNKVRQVRDNVPEHTDIIVLPETVLSGYPVEDLVLKPAFIDAAMDAVTVLARESADKAPALLLTTPWRQDGKVYNAVHLIHGGKVVVTRFKTNLPNYGVFDDKRVFESAPPPAPIDFKGHRLGVMICEDMWSARVADNLQDHGATILIVTNASPFEKGKHDKRLRVAAERAAGTGLPLIYVNQCCGQDDLVYDGGSFILNEKGVPVFTGERFAEAVYNTTWEMTATGHWLCVAPKSIPAPENEVYQAAMLGLRDYVTKNGFPGVILGMSGGIDSALSAAIAVDALGPDAVQAVMMPSDYTGSESVEDAAACSNALGIHHDVIAIKNMVKAFEMELQPYFNTDTPGIVHENIQPRCRGIILMALSNANGKMVLSTGNKSELAVGYATLYGDMCGGYNVLKDIYKTEVYALARWRNLNKPRHGFGPAGGVIPERILTKAPTAELRPGQTDQDTLPPYDVLDGILHGLVEEDLDLKTLVARGYGRETVLRVWKMLDTAEYKRRQSCPGPKIGPKAFTRDRRYPLVNRFLKTVENQG